MRNLIAAFIALLALGISAFAESQPAGTFNWQQFRRLPVLDAGRHKPLDTLARETLRAMWSDRASFTDPETGQKLDPTAMYLVMLFDWRGWDQPPDPHAAAMMGPSGEYLVGHKPDKWDRAALLRVDTASLRQALGMARNQEYISPVELSRAEIRDPHTGEQAPFLTWAAKLFRSRPNQATTFEKKGLELADKLFSYQAHRMGKRLQVIPVEGSEHQDWVSIDFLLRSKLDDQTDPSGGMRKATEQFRKARKAWLDGSPETFNQAATAFIATARQFGPQLGSYPPQLTIDLEVAYNRFAPFSLAWVCTLVAFLSLLLAAVTRWRVLFIAGLGTFIAGSVAMLVGLAMRTIIRGWVPVTNLYESVVFMAFGTIVLGLIFGLLSRKRYMLTAAAAVATIALVLADCCPSVLDPSIRPLQPVLRSNYWLAIHVITIMLSYAAFALALAIGDITLGYYLVGSRKQETINTQTRFTYKTLQAGVLFLVAGIFLGAAWADDSWGRFWGWDRKEVWALITLLGYLAVLHARRAGWVGNLGLAAWSVICFAMVVMAWYGVNLLGAGGLHNYALGGDAAAYFVLGAVLVQFLYVAWAVAKARSRMSPSWSDEPRTV